MRFIFTLLLSAILYSNTFSPQYLIWVAPFVAFLSDLEVGLMVFASFLTWFYFRNWDSVISLEPMDVSILILRNIVLIVVLLISVYKLLKKK